MMLFAGVVFVSALILIVLLFTVKLREARTGRVFARGWRRVLDAEALHIKDLLSAAELDLKKIPPLVMYWGHVATHRAALEFARAARIASWHAHRLADFVSHKHNFQRRVTRSEFLKKVSARKTGQNVFQDDSGRREID